MKSLKTVVIVVLALTSIGGGMLAWQQYAELVELRAAALTKDERAALQKRIWELDRYNKELSDQLAAQREIEDAADSLMVGEPSAPGGGPGGFREGRGGRGGRGGGNNPLQLANALRAVLAKPEVQALVSFQNKAAVEARYASLFKSLGLSPEQADKVKTILADRENTRQDVITAAAEQGITDRREIQKLMASARAEIDNNLKAVLGDAGFNQLTTYEQTMPQRNLVNQLQQRLSYSDTPLSQAQADQLVQVLAANPAPQRTNAVGAAAQPGRGNRGGGGGGIGGGLGGDLGAVIGAVGGNLGGLGGGGGGVIITPAAMTQAQSVLAAPQVAALQQIQQQQQTQQQLAQILRDTVTAQLPNGGAAGAAKAGTNGAAKGTGNNRKKGGGG